jgi:hypothetical protein
MPPEKVKVPNEGEQEQAGSSPAAKSLLFCSTLLPSVPLVLFTSVHKDEGDE